MPFLLTKGKGIYCSKLIQRAFGESKNPFLRAVELPSLPSPGGDFGWFLFPLLLPFAFWTIGLRSWTWASRVGTVALLCRAGTCA